MEFVDCGFGENGCRHARGRGCGGHAARDQGHTGQGREFRPAAILRSCPSPLILIEQWSSRMGGTHRSTAIKSDTASGMVPSRMVSIASGVCLQRCDALASARVIYRVPRCLVCGWGGRGGGGGAFDREHEVLLGLTPVLPTPPRSFADPSRHIRRTPYLRPSTSLSFAGTPDLTAGGTAVVVTGVRTARCGPSSPPRVDLTSATYAGCCTGRMLHSELTSVRHSHRDHAPPAGSQRGSGPADIDPCNNRSCRVDGSRSLEEPSGEQAARPHPERGSNDQW